MKLTKTKKKNNSKNKSLSIFKYLMIVFCYLFFWYRKKNSEYLESSKKIINKERKNSLRKPLVFPITNPNIAIKTDWILKKQIDLKNPDDLKKLEGREYKKERSKYLKSLSLESKKKKEDLSFNLKKYNHWRFFWPFYFLWIKLIRLLNLDLIINRDSRYEFNNEQLEIYIQRQKQYKKFLDSIVFLQWFRRYFNYLKEKIQSKKYQRNNWIVFGIFTAVYLICFSVIISYASFIINGEITHPAFSNGKNYPNFFFDKYNLANATLDLSVVGIIFMFIPILILISLWLSNINDANHNVIFVYSQQLIYLIVGIFLISSACMEITLFYSN